MLAQTPIWLPAHSTDLADAFERQPESVPGHSRRFLACPRHVRFERNPGSAGGRVRRFGHDSSVQAGELNHAGINSRTLKRLPSGLASEKPRGIPRIDDRRVLPCAPRRAVLQQDQLGGHPTGKSVHRCPAPREKIFWFSEDPNHLYIRDVPSHTEGRFAIVTDVGAGCGGREGVFDERH
jgi:hypothetical protein